MFDDNVDPLGEPDSALNIASDAERVAHRAMAMVNAPDGDIPMLLALDCPGGLELLGHGLPSDDADKRRLALELLYDVVSNRDTAAALIFPGYWSRLRFDDPERSEMMGASTEPERVEVVIVSAFDRYGDARMSLAKVTRTQDAGPVLHEFQSTEDFSDAHLEPRSDTEPAVPAGTPVWSLFETALRHGLHIVEAGGADLRWVDWVLHADYMPGRNDPCQCGSGVKFKHCHAEWRPVTPDWRERSAAGRSA